ncbi:unnamed protein product [Macrosiphum euphorbiae]|uniref:Uncharacterized protein n=1 Tax=Macrosiphum euphorbiae TaxID=13131 RepID=A0AAV0X3D7_9HEMI|nr:unnamed protein product [Macrosiphum euphorbiae]
MTVISNDKMVMSPLAGYNRSTPCRVEKNVYFLPMTLLLAVISIAFMFVPKVPLEMGVEMKCQSGNYF